MKRTIKLAIYIPLLAWFTYKEPLVAGTMFFGGVALVLFIRGIGLLSYWIDDVANGR